MNAGLWPFCFGFTLQTQNLHPYFILSMMWTTCDRLSLPGFELDCIFFFILKMFHRELSDSCTCFCLCKFLLFTQYHLISSWHMCITGPKPGM